jgi:NAD(P)-dependent dehydrogenase (short-subunit alcohol dehydrogenase family)
MYLDRLRLDGHVAIVVGAGGGRMGTESAQALAEVGATVVGMDLSAERLAQTQEQVAGRGGSFIPSVVDVSDPAAFPRALAAVWRDVGPVQHLVHVVGGNRPGNYRDGAGIAKDAGLAPLDTYSDERFDTIIDFNVGTAFRTCRDVARRLIDAGLPGTMVTFSAIAGMNGAPGIGAYGAAKAAVIAMTRTMAVEWGPYGLRVNSVAPGQTQSAEPRVGAAFLDADMVDLSVHPLGRAADVTDIASAVLFLSTDLSRSVTGQTVIVDAGVTSRLQILAVPTVTTGA